MKKTALIMAGGKGERFWPRSRRNYPKQFLSLTGEGKTMIQLTVDRLLPIINIEDIYISTNEKYRMLVREQLPNIPENNILCEPVGRNTAPCIGLGAVHIQKKYRDAVMLVLPSDHEIRRPEAFRKVLQEVCGIAEQGPNLVTIGITPLYPETGYGYIKYHEDISLGSAFEVEKFVEKPVLELAREYLASGNYLWNSGMFGWKVSTLLENMSRFMPDNYARLLRIRDAVGTPEEDEVLQKEFPEMESQSIDYGIMEKADHIYTIPGDFGWDDVGSWLAVGRLKEEDKDGNVMTGDVLPIGTESCIIQGGKKLIATVGLKDLVIVDTEDAILISSKEKTGEIKKILEQLRRQGRHEYL